MFSQTTFDTPMKELSLYINKPFIEPELCFEIIGDMKYIGDKYNINNVI